MTTFKELKKQIKEQQKALAASITRGKIFRKPSQQSNMTDDDKKIYCWKNSIGYAYDISRLDYSSRDYRHRHIAYCMFFNKTPYHKIESECRDNNGPNLDIVDRYMKEWEKQIEVICDNS